MNSLVDWSTVRRLRSRLASRRCACRHMRLYGATVELAGLKHTRAGCFPCDGYGHPL